MSCRPLLISTPFDNSVVGKRFQARREQIARDTKIFDQFVEPHNVEE